MMASSAWEVQILLVAFSRRICCSRVCMAMRRAWFAATIDGHPMMRRGGALVGVAGGEIGAWGCRNPSNAKALGITQHHVGAQGAGRFHQQQWP